MDLETYEQALPDSVIDRAYRDLPEKGNDPVAIKDDYITVPELILARTHLRVSSISLVKLERLKHLQRSPAMVHKDLDVQVGVVIAVHGKPAALGQRVDDGGMSVEVAVALDAAKAETAGGLVCWAVEDDLVDGSVVVVEAGQGTDGSEDHGAVVSGCLAGCDSIPKGLHLLHDAGCLVLQSLLEAVIPEADDTLGVLLQITLVLGFVSLLTGNKCNCKVTYIKSHELDRCGLGGPVSIKVSLKRLLSSITSQDQSLGDGHV